MLPLVALFCMLETIGCQSTTSTLQTTHSVRPVRLQLLVSVPVSMNLLRDGDIAESFGLEVLAALHTQGFKGRIKVLDEGDITSASVAILNILLLEWRGTRDGEIECTFRASLTTSCGMKELGIFYGQHLSFWDNRDWLLRSDDYHVTAAQSMNSLGERIKLSGLFPNKAAP